MDVFETDSGKALVAPYVGAWIEIIHTSKFLSSISVAPYVGAWIEIVVVQFK